jgi:serine/threonine protein kinase
MLVNEPYELLEKLGSGGMGQVYRARDTRLNRIVAVKALKADMVCTPEQRRRFLQEAQAASALNHPNIVTIHDMVSENGRELMVMEYVSGNSLRDLIPPGGMSAEELVHYGIQLADALTAAHGAGIIHRDLKPGNIMVTERGLVKILDFGLAKLPAALLFDDAETRADSAPLTVEGSLLGTVAYMSPEQAEGRPVDSRSDIFSFGSVLYEMATGERPFDRGNTVSTLTAVLRDQPRPLAELAPGLPYEVQEIVDRCLRKNPDERWQSAAEIYQVFLTLRHSSDSGTIQRSRLDLPPAEEAEVAPPSSRRLQWIAVAFVTLLLVSAAGWWFFVGMKPAQSPPSAVRHNDDVLKMLQAHVPESAIIANIKGVPTSFDLSATQLVMLTKAGASEKLLAAMRGESAPVPADTGAGATSSPAPPDSTTPPKAGGAATTATPAATTGNPSASPSKATSPTNPPTPGTSVSPEPPATPATGAVVPPASAVPAPKGAKTVVVADGTPFRLSLGEDIPDDIGEGTIIRFELDADLVVNGVTVLAKGARATATIVEEKKKKLFGRGKISYRMNTIQGIDGKQLRIRARPAANSPPATKHPLETPGTKPKDIAAEKGTHFVAYLDGDAQVTSQK